MLGKPADIVLVHPGRANPSLPWGVRLLAAPSVAEDLKLTDAQKAKAAAAADRYRRQAPKAPDGVIGGLGIAVDAEATAGLDAGQRKRLAELKLQLGRAERPYNFYQGAVVAKAL